MSLTRMSGRALGKTERASTAEPATTTSAPCVSRRRWRNSRVSGSSSTTSTVMASSDTVEDEWLSAPSADGGRQGIAVTSLEGNRKVRLLEPIEDMWKEFRADSRATVGHGKLRVGANMTKSHDDVSATGCELDRIRE